MLTQLLCVQIRDQLNLTYDVTFEAGLNDSYQVAWWSVHVTSKPENIHQAVAACLDVLRSVGSATMQPYELERAKVTVLAKHEAEVKVRIHPQVAHLETASNDVMKPI